MIEWESPDRLRVGERTFDVIDARPAAPASATTAIRKSVWSVQRYLELARLLAPERMIELGIDQGGSTVFFALAFGRLQQLLAVDIGDVPAALQEFASEQGPGAHLHTVGGVDQSDRVGLGRLVEDVFGDQPLDLIVDDASHRLAQTRVSFDLLFPRLRPGGVFVVEDWSWQHRVGRAIADRMASGEIDVPADAADRPPPPMPLSRLLLECVLVAASAPEVISAVSVRQGWAEVERGPAALDDGFALADHLGWTGRGVLDPSFAEG